MFIRRKEDERVSIVKYTIDCARPGDLKRWLPWWSFAQSLCSHSQEERKTKVFSQNHPTVGVWAINMGCKSIWLSYPAHCTLSYTRVHYLHTSIAPFLLAPIVPSHSHCPTEKYLPPHSNNQTIEMYLHMHKESRGRANCSYPAHKYTRFPFSLVLIACSSYILLTLLHHGRDQRPGHKITPKHRFRWPIRSSPSGLTE